MASQKLLNLSQVEKQYKNHSSWLLEYLEFWSEPKWKFASRDDQLEKENVTAILRLINEANGLEAYERTHFTPGHITGSALICNQELDRVLLTHHKKLDKWLQLGGHSDGSSKTYEVAHREAEEESGLKEFSFLNFSTGRTNHLVPFDVDIHEIPARKSEPEHKHFDIRFLFVADDKAPFVVSDESNDLKWFSLAEAREANDEMSMLRQYDKLEALKKHHVGVSH